MSDEMHIEGKSYISSKRAAELSGYAQDYIGQLARKSLIDAQRIGGLWYVSMDSLQSYKKKADEYKPAPPQRPEASEPGSLIFFDGKEYLSAAKAAEVTGYTQDYVGQLARSGIVFSHQVGNRWYIERQSIVTHKKEKDALLAAVQSEAVGLSKRTDSPKSHPEYQSNIRHSGFEPLLNYYSDGGDLLPMPAKAQEHEPEIFVKSTLPPERELTSPKDATRQVVPIKKRTTYRPLLSSAYSGQDIVLPMPKERPYPGLILLLGAAATIVIVISVGYASILKQNSAYASNIPTLHALPASVWTAVSDIGNLLEPLLTHELVYQRLDS